MLEFLNQILQRSETPIISAFILGLMTAISPCPMATNITAIGFISRKLENPHKVFQSGIFYTFGRVASYVLLAVVLYLGADQLKISSFFQQHSEKFLGPVLILVGLMMLGILSIRLPAIKSSDFFEKKKRFTFIDAFMIGFLFAMAFCPYSGVLYFGILIPMTISQPAGLVLPLVFALATAIPVLVISWLLAFMLSGIGKFYNRIQLYERWFRRIIAALFIAAGLYYIITTW